MIQALLLDLDDTLLQTNFDQFLPAYLQRLAAALEDYAPAEKVIAELSEGTTAMIADREPARTLKQAFDAHFYPALGTSEQELRPTLEHFYAEIYPELQSLTEPAPGARELVDLAQQRELRLVVATNPLFPLTAIEQRLAWAGFDGASTPFEFVTAYETLHFAKPHLEYYAEILGRLGLPPGAAALVGDDLENDIEPARALGMKVFHLSESTAPGVPAGNLADARTWLQELDQPDDGEPLPADLDPKAIAARLRGHLAALLQLAGEPNEAWRERPSPRQLAPLELVCHFRDVEREVWQPRLKQLINQETPFLDAADTESWADERGYQREQPGAALQAALEARRATLALLSGLSADVWDKPARHALLGPTTLAGVMQRAADQDLDYLNQLRTLAS